jgi:hypothetical protein
MSINHLLSVDDSLLLLKINDGSAQCLQNILSLYEDCSGQIINKEKASIMFSRNTNDAEKQELMASLDIGSEVRNEKYLGLPVYIGRSKSKTFAYLKDRVWKRIQGWKKKLISKAGKEILIKPVAQAIPTYAMSCFDLTKTLCDEIRAMVFRFWWAQMDRDNSLHWMAWELLCSRKNKGGLGFRDPHMFSLAMLTRQGWRLIENPDSLCAEVLKVKYFSTGSLLDAKEILGCSYSWRSIVRGIQALKECLIWRVGNGEKINIWLGPWIPNKITWRSSTPRGRILVNRVCDLIDPTTGTWDQDLTRNLFWEEDANLIFAIPLKQTMDDFLAWHYDKMGLFSMKSAYHVLEDRKSFEAQPQEGASTSGSQNPLIDWLRLWKLPIREPRWSIFFIGWHRIAFLWRCLWKGEVLILIQDA